MKHRFWTMRARELYGSSAAPPLLCWHVLVFDIKKQGPAGQFIDWSASACGRSFWLLAGVLLLMGLYGWGMTRFETQARKAVTEADVLGIALQQQE